jgi:hypothetical protein
MFDAAALVRPSLLRCQLPRSDAAGSIRYEDQSAASWRGGDPRDALSNQPLQRSAIRNAHIALWSCSRPLNAALGSFAIDLSCAMVFRIRDGQRSH